MVHIFVFQIAKMAVSYVGHKTHLELVGWHNNEKLVLLGTPEQAVWFALILSVVLVVPVAALAYRWIERPALDAARRGVSVRAVARRVLGTTLRLAHVVRGGLAVMRIRRNARLETQTTVK
jgi:peptidoglycan/LPS O-acetylase OafA/YrhL